MIGKGLGAANTPPHDSARAGRSKAPGRSPRLIDLRPGEGAAALASFAMFFLLLSSYYIVRPVRDEMGVTAGRDTLHILFSIVFVVMLAAVPVYGWVASTVSRRIVLPTLYLAFVATLVGFWAWFRVTSPGPTSASVFFVWASVFNLFVVSLFWSLMAEMWDTADAKRVFGFIAAGGTAGAMTGPLLTQGLIRFFQPVDLLLVSAALLLAALGASLVLRHVRGSRQGGSEKPLGGGIFDGAKQLLKSPFLARIAVYIFLANIVGTFFYLEQSRLVALHLADAAERVQFFSGRDLMVNTATLAIQIFGTARILQSLGLKAALLSLPVTATIGTLALWSSPSLTIVAAVMVAERVVAFALANPALKVMYTMATPEQQYKVQNFNDTVVYRGGDAAAGWIFAAVGGGLGFAAAATPLVGLAGAGLWLWMASGLRSGDTVTGSGSETDRASEAVKP